MKQIETQNHRQWSNQLWISTYERAISTNWKAISQDQVEQWYYVLLSSDEHSNQTYDAINQFAALVW